MKKKLLYWARLRTSSQLVAVPRASLYPAVIQDFQLKTSLLELPYDIQVHTARLFWSRHNSIGLVAVSIRTDQEMRSHSAR